MGLHERLTAAVLLMEEKKKLLSRMKQTQQMLRTERDRSLKLKCRLASEGRDVERLEGLTLINLIHTILGSKEEAQQKERQEYLAAKLQYDESCAAIRDLKTEMDDMETEWKGIGDPEAEYQAVLREKEDFLICSGGSAAERLFAIDQQKGRLQAGVQELEEAIVAGEELETALIKMESHLSSARSFGAWDILGGGLLVTAAKHSRINHAQGEVHRVQQLLRRFERELADVEIESGVGLGGLASFADYFFDGFIVDCIIQNKINSSLNCTREQKMKIQQIVASLRQKLEESQEDIAELDERRKRTIEEA
jgi:hypothetical protein